MFRFHKYYDLFIDFVKNDRSEYWYLNLFINFLNDQLSKYHPELIKSIIKNIINNKILLIKIFTQIWWFSNKNYF